MELAKSLSLVSEKNRAFVIDRDQLKKLPAGVLEYWHKLSPELQEQIFPSEKTEAKKEKLEEVVGVLSEELKEKFMERYLAELFNTAGYRQYFPTEQILSEEAAPGRIRERVLELLDVIWNNRGKRGDDLELMDNDFYEQFYEEEQKLAQDFVKVKKELEAFRKSMANKKRLTNQQKNKKKELETKQQAIKGLRDEFDRRHKNTDLDAMYFRDVKSRERKARKWLEGTVVVAEYFEPFQLSVLVAAQLGTHFLRVGRIHETGKDIRKEVIPEVRARAEEMINAYQAAIEEWQKVHDDEKAFKEMKKATFSEKQKKLIGYFYKLYESFLSQLERGGNEETARHEIMQMENILNVLIKMEEKKDAA